MQPYRRLCAIDARCRESSASTNCKTRLQDWPRITDANPVTHHWGHIDQCGPPPSDVIPVGPGRLLDGGSIGQAGLGPWSASLADGLKLGGHGEEG
ncbi:hypothetical protein NDU88_002161 [Pleurodeles waltl]|uniref:Uncharacterized protein n=1 Tax=Pleurodeles waltl TaxID=8319 RepID=A0AAV7NEM3_PLEWA|nr:hypothetical protein NDU88_002161 [Pleurodeles waltl]